jgi:predicted PhzF superfamily epimerase YddE/YHI9
MLVYNSEEEVKNINIDRSYFDKINLGYGGVIITAQGNNVDFVSRYFTPQATFLEDPVTGSAHCTLIPYWSSRLNKNKLKALQISSRGGSLICENNSDRVIIGGQAKTSFISEVKI